MSTSKSKAKTTAPDPRKARTGKIILASAAVVLVIAVAVIIRLAVGSGGGVQGVLQAFYEGLYNADIDKMAECLPEGKLRDDFELVFTLGGVSNMAVTYQSQAVEWAGADFTVAVDIVEQEKPSSTALNAAQAENSAVESVADVTFDIHIDGSAGGKHLRGETRLLRIGGTWYLSEYNILTGVVEE